MTAPFDWARLAYYTSYIYRHEDQYAAAAYLRERIEAEFVPRDVHDRIVENTLGHAVNEHARAEAAEAENARLRAALQFCTEAPLSGWTIAQGYARQALGGEHE